MYNYWDNRIIYTGLPESRILYEHYINHLLVKRGFLILIVGCFLVLFGFSFFILYVTEWFGKMDAPIMQPREGFDYIVFIFGRSGFLIGIFGIVIQAIGGVILYFDKKSTK